MATATATAPVIDQNIERTKQEYREGLATSSKQRSLSLLLTRVP